MAVDRRRIYFNAVLGALGGLVGWALISLGASFRPRAPWASISRTP